MIWPVPGHYTITSGYADTRSYGLHAGFDIAAPAVPCVTVGRGIVIFTGWAGSAGRSVYVELEGGYRVHYCHLSRIDVVVDQAVAAGDTIGLVGGSGHEVDNYYGSHLHLNLFAATQPAGELSKWIAWVGMWAVDPELYLSKEDDDMDEAGVRKLIAEHASTSPHYTFEQIADHLPELNAHLTKAVKALIAALVKEHKGKAHHYSFRQITDNILELNTTLKKQVKTLIGTAGGTGEARVREIAQEEDGKLKVTK